MPYDDLLLINCEMVRDILNALLNPREYRRRMTGSFRMNRLLDGLLLFLEPLIQLL